MENTNECHKAYPASATAAKLIMDGYGFPDEYLGLTKRELFAAMCLQGLLAGGWNKIETTAGIAVEHADMLINALNSNQ